MISYFFHRKPEEYRTMNLVVVYTVYKKVETVLYKTDTKDPTLHP